MIRALAVVFVLAATAHSASAGVYGSIGIGSTDVSDDKGSFTQNSRTLRFAAGYRLSNLFSAEGGVMGYRVANGPVGLDGREFYAAGLLHCSLGNNFEIFGRLGVQRTGVAPNTNDGSFTGTGYLAGVGVDYEIKLPTVPQIARAALWIDYNRSGTTLQRDASLSHDYAVGMWSLGVTLGF